MATIHLHYYANTVGRSASAEVIIPQNLPVGEERRNCPVLYLLHGACEDENAFINKTSIERYACRHNLTVVMPSAENSDYTNMKHGQNYYSLIANEMPELMFKFFGMYPYRENCHIAGISMGANGAMKVGFANPDKYGTIGCLSGAVTYKAPPNDTYHLDPVLDRDDYMKYDSREIIDTVDDTLGNILKVSAGNKPAPKVYHTIGSEDFIINYARDTKKIFESLNKDVISYTYEEYPGKHDWDFWDKALERYIDFIFQNKKQ